MQKAISDFLKTSEVDFSEKEDLSKRSFIGIGGIYDTASPKDEKTFVELLELLLNLGAKFKIIGRLSNTIVAGEKLDVVVTTDKMQGYRLAENTVTALCGARYASLSQKAASIDISLEPRLSGIPGSLGGMIYCNAGAYGAEISDIFISATVYDFHSRRIKVLDRSDMRFSYRRSALSDGGMALISATLRTEKSSSEKVSCVRCEYMKRRMESQPVGARTLGSTFKRCGDICPARLIDELGLKGFSVGGARISPKHAGFIENSGGATVQDVKILIATVKQRVFDEYGIALEEEIEIV